MIKEISRIKIYLFRANSYLNILNMGMLIVTLLLSLKIGIIKTAIIAPVLFIITIAILIIVGYYDTKLKIFENESRYSSQNNPYFVEILERVKNIEEKINGK